MFRDEDSPNSQELTKFSPLVEFLNVMEYYQARKMVFDYSSKYQEESWKYDAQQSIFDRIQGVSMADETLSRENGEVKLSKSMLIETGYPNFLHGCDFPCFNLNY